MPTRGMASGAGRYALMQPYFMPYLGYFSLIARTDAWIVFDTAQFIKGGWIARNRALKAGGGFDYFTVPVRKHPHDTPIRSVQIADDVKWRRRLINQFEPWRRAPGYARVRELLETVVNAGDETICALNVRALEQVCALLNLPFRPVLLSDLPPVGESLPAGTVPGAGDWGWLVGRALGGRVYVNPPGGRDLFDPAAFARHGIEIEITRNRLRPYDQGGATSFEPGLSVLDALLWLEPARVLDLVLDVETERLVLNG